MSSQPRLLHHRLRNTITATPAESMPDSWLRSRVMALIPPSYRRSISASRVCVDARLSSPTSTSVCVAFSLAAVPSGMLGLRRAAPGVRSMRCVVVFSLDAVVLCFATLSSAPSSFPEPMLVVLGT